MFPFFFNLASIYPSCAIHAFLIPAIGHVQLVYYAELRFSQPMTRECLKSITNFTRKIGRSFLNMALTISWYHHLRSMKPIIWANSLSYGPAFTGLVSLYQKDCWYWILPGLLTSSVIKDSPNEYRLTGVNTFQTENLPGSFYAVNGPTMARIGGKQNAQCHYKAFTQFYDGDSRKPPRVLLFEDKPIGYFVHTHCWELLGRVEGPGLKNMNLAELVQTYQNYWTRDSRWAGIDTYSVNPLMSRLSIRSLTGKMKVPGSPLWVPEIQEAIKSAEAEGYRPPSVFDIIPSELVIEIAEHVCPVGVYTLENVQDLGNMLLGFGWVLPAWFWRQRLDESFFFELEKIPDTSSAAAWKARLNLMCLAEDPNSMLISGLVNRERLLRIMLFLKKPEASTNFEGRHGDRGCVNFVPNLVT